MRQLYNFAAFQAGWFACVLGAARGASWIGVPCVALILAVHLWITRARHSEWKLLAASLPIGFVVDNALQSSHAIVTTGPSFAPRLAALWFLPLWPLFASLFGESMRWMRGRYVAGALFGAIGAPLSYWAGERLGALAFGELARSIAIVSVTWSLAMLALLALQARFTART